MSNTAQTHVECIGLCGIARERVDLCGHRENHAERISLCWTLRKRTLSALGRNTPRKESLWHVHAANNAEKSPSRDPCATAARLCMCRCRSFKESRTNAHRVRRIPKGTARNRCRTSAEQRDALPLKGAALPANNKSPNERIAVVELARELNRHAASATHEQTHLAEHPGQLVWIFMGMSVVGLVGETLQHLVAFGELESRAGFIWGPFSPIYGLAAVLLTMLLEPLQDKGVPLLLAVSAVVGGSLEYFASWAMETFWGVVAWSYLNIPLNFDGRTDVFHCLIWGTIGVLWVKVGLQLCQRIFNRVNTTGGPYRVATAALSIFMALDIVMTIVVLLRADARTDGIPPQNPIEQFCDTAYPTDMLQKRFHNMGGLGI